METQYGFPKSERLRHKKLIDELFVSGQRSFKHPIMAVWKVCDIPEKVSAQVGFSVPKKHYKRAVKRNLVKRRLREAYRLQKQELVAALEAEGKQVAILFVTLKTDNISYEELSPKILLLLREIAAKIQHA